MTSLEERPGAEGADSAVTGRLRARRAADVLAGRPMAKLVPDRRRYRRVPVKLFGRFMRCLLYTSPSPRD